MALMTGRGFQEEGEAAGKWRRALLTSTQLSTYFVGYSEVAEIAAARPAGHVGPAVARRDAGARLPAAPPPAYPARRLARRLAGSGGTDVLDQPAGDRVRRRQRRPAGRPAGTSGPRSARGRRPPVRASGSGAVRCEPGEHHARAGHRPRLAAEVGQPVDPSARPPRRPPGAPPAPTSRPPRRSRRPAPTPGSVGPSACRTSSSCSGSPGGPGRRMATRTAGRELHRDVQLAAGAAPGVLAGHVGQLGRAGAAVAVGTPPGDHLQGPPGERGERLGQLDGERPPAEPGAERGVGRGLGGGPDRTPSSVPSGIRLVPVGRSATRRDRRRRRPAAGRPPRGRGRPGPAARRPPRRGRRPAGGGRSACTPACRRRQRPARPVAPRGGRRRRRTSDVSRDRVSEALPA